MQRKLLFCCLTTSVLTLGTLVFAQENKLKPGTGQTDFTKSEPGEALPGGQATSRKSNDRNAYSHSSGNLPINREFDFKIGNGIFKKLWVSAPSSTQSSDGLGPLYNARACQRCHLKDGRGHPPSTDDPKDNAVSMLIRLSVPPNTDKEKKDLAAYLIKNVPDPVYGGQLQDFAIKGHLAEGDIHIDYSDVPVKLNGGTIITLRAPKYSIKNPGYGALSPNIQMSPRIANPMIGLGLLEAIKAKDILANADPDDKNSDGISGKPNWVMSIKHKKVMLGRFGWKAGQPSIAQQTAGAFAGDIGISTQLISDAHGDCTTSQKDCRSAPNGNSPKYQNVEAGKTMFDLVTFYSQNLAVPHRRGADDPQVLKGKELFYKSGCIACHQPKFVTGNLPGQTHLSNQLIWPYTDMLLHDMGSGLADNRPEGAANGQEWRTAPLWGIGLTKTVNGHTFFLHDGRARNLLEAILWHGGEAEAAKQKVIEMMDSDRRNLIKFIESL